MTCLKCGGLMTREPIWDLFDSCLLWRCIQCGMMIDWLVLRNRQTCRAEGVEMPKFRDEEHRRNWIEGVRRAKAERKSIQAAALSLPMSRAASNGNAGAPVGNDLLPAIDRALRQLEIDRAALERAKEILSR